MFVNNSIDLTCITYFLYKTVLNCLVAVKSCFWQYDLWLIFRKVLKIYVIIIFPDPKPLFCIRELSSCCFSINFWGYRHSHSGNFRREAKKRCWKITKKFLTFLTLFKTLRTSQERHGDLFGQLEEFVCFVCCAKVDSINNVKWNKFDHKLQRKHKVADFTFLTPCKQVHLYHAIPEIKDHGGFLMIKCFE